jgi:hypothetical protein
MGKMMNELRSLADRMSAPRAQKNARIAAGVFAQMS